MEGIHVAFPGRSRQRDCVRFGPPMLKALDCTNQFGVPPQIGPVLKASKGTRRTIMGIGIGLREG